MIELLQLTEAVLVATAVTMTVVAARKAQTKITEIPNPPGIGPNNCPILISKSSAILDFSSIIPMKIKSGIAIKVSLSTSQYTPLKFVIPAFNHWKGPSDIKYSLGFPSIKYPANPAKKMDIIAEPGRAKAKGYPDARAKAIKKINKKRKNNSIIYSF